MKKNITTVAFIIVLLAMLPLRSLCQGIGIGTAVPNASAILDVSSTNKGFLLPRLTYLQRTSIASPAAGLLVYQTNNSTTPAGFYIYSATGWKEMAKAEDIIASNTWTISGNNQYSAVNGFVGIGTSVPSEKLHVSNGQIRLSRNSLFENNIVFNMPASSSLTSENEGLRFSIADVDKGFVGFTSSPFAGDYFRISTAGLGGSQLAINSLGNVGIGTVQPSEKLHVAGNLLLNTTNPTLQLQNAGVDKGFFQLSGDDLRFGTNSGNSAGNVILRMNGANRFQFEETGRMTLLADATPTLYFNTGGVNRAYLQLQGSSIRLDAPANKVYIGDDLTVDDATNRVGIGTTAPDAKLHVTGDIKSNTGKVLNSGNVNMLPVAFGFVRASLADAPVLRGTANLSAYRYVGVNSNKEIRLLVSGVNLLNATVMVTSGNHKTFAVTNSSGLNADGSVTVQLWSILADDFVNGDFHVVIYAP